MFSESAYLLPSCKLLQEGGTFHQYDEAGRAFLHKKPGEIRRKKQTEV